MVSMSSVREQIVQRYDIGENTAVFILFQAKGCDQSVADRIFRRNHFSDPFWSAEQYPIVVLVNSEVVACKFDLAHIDHIIIALDEQINLHSLLIVLSFRPCRRRSNHTGYP